MKLAIIGSTDFYDKDYLSKFVKKNINKKIDEIIVENIYGTSKIAMEFAKENNINVKIQSYTKLSKEKFGNSAPHINNSIIAKECDIILAVNHDGDENYKHNKNIIERVKKLGKPIFLAPEKDVELLKTPRKYLFIPYQEKAQVENAISMGARYDKNHGEYYVVSIEEQKACAKWIPEENLDKAIVEEIRKLKNETFETARDMKNGKQIGSRVEIIDKLEARLLHYSEYYQSKDRQKYEFYPGKEDVIYLNVDIENKDRIKKNSKCDNKIEGVNGRWDPRATKWYVTNINSFLLAKEVDKDHYLTLDKLIESGKIKEENLHLPTKSDMEFIRGIIDNAEKFSVKTSRTGYEVDSKKFYEFIESGKITIEKIRNDYIFANAEGFHFIAIDSARGHIHIYNDYEEFKLKLNNSQKKEILSKYEKDFDFNNEREIILNEHSLPVNPLAEIQENKNIIELENSEHIYKNAKDIFLNEKLSPEQIAIEENELSM